MSQGLHASRETITICKFATVKYIKVHMGQTNIETSKSTNCSIVMLCLIWRASMLKGTENFQEWTTIFDTHIIEKNQIFFIRKYRHDTLMQSYVFGISSNSKFECIKQPNSKFKRQNSGTNLLFSTLHVISEPITIFISFFNLFA